MILVCWMGSFLGLRSWWSSSDFHGEGVVIILFNKIYIITIYFPDYAICNKLQLYIHGHSHSSSIWGGKGLTYFTLGHPSKTHIWYPTIVTWLRVCPMTIIMKGIRFEVNIQRATQAYKWKRAGVGLTIRLLVILCHCQKETWGWVMLHVP